MYLSYRICHIEFKFMRVLRITKKVSTKTCCYNIAFISIMLAIPEMEKKGNLHFRSKIKVCHIHIKISSVILLRKKQL